MPINKQHTEKRTLVAIIIPVYNDPEGLCITLESLARQLLSQQLFEIIVANDGGSKDISTICESFGVKYVNIVPNQGSYNARNKAMELAQTNAFAFVDADITVPSDWLKNGLEALKHADYVAGPVEIVRKEKMSVAELYEYYTAFKIKHYMEKLHFGVTANLFVKKGVFEKLGLFNDNLKSSGDLEFGDRVHAHGGFTQCYEESLLVYHPPRGKEKYLGKIKRGVIGQINLKKEYPERFKFINLSPLYTIIKTLVPPKIFHMENSQDKGKRSQLFFFSWYIKFLRCYYILKYK